MPGRMVTVTALWFLLIATACGDGASDISLPDASSVSTGPAPAPAATPLPGPLFLGVSIQVRGRLSRRGQVGRER